MTSTPAQLDRRALLLLPLAALVATLPLMVHGCSCGHDIDFHLLSWMEAANQFSHGNLHPHWAYTPAFNAGEPRFVFYPPISWYLGALLGLVLTHLPRVSEAAGWAAAPIAFTWIALTAAGFAMHRLARAFASPNAALLATILYLASPYMLFTAYERTAYGELLAAAWMPLLLLAILHEEVTIPRIAVPLALLWLTNAPAAVMGSYTLALLAAIRIVRAAAKDRKAAQQLALRMIAGTALGLGLASFYILPAAYERRYVQIAMATIAGMRIDGNFLFGHTGGTPDEILHDAVLHTVSVIAVLLLSATAIAFAGSFFLRKSRQPQTLGDPQAPIASLPILSLALLTAGIGFLLTRWSMPLWSHAPQATFLQFPWRLLAVLAVVFALAAAGALHRLRLSSTSTGGMALVLAAALAFPAYHFFRQTCDPEDTPAARLALYHSNAGTYPTDEYTPVDADNEALKATDPPYWLAHSSEAAGLATAKPGPTPSHFTVTANHVEELILNLRDYPSWRILKNGAVDSQREHRDDGLIAFPIPAGSSTIDIRFAGLADETGGDAISLLALVLLLFSLRIRRVR